MNALITLATSHRHTLVAMLAASGIAFHSDAIALAQDISFDFARLVEFREVARDEARASTSHERVIEMTLPISVRFQGLTTGEVELLDFEIDGAPAGIRIHSFSPTTELAAEAVSVETINKTIKEKSIGASLSGKLPVPIGRIRASARCRFGG